ncbi:hypothetical protein WAI453_001763 [Rhynchosporium graminicola]
MPLSRLTLSCSIFEYINDLARWELEYRKKTNSETFLGTSSHLTRPKKVLIEASAFLFSFGKALASGAGGPTATVEVVKKLVGGGGVGDKGDVSSGVLKRLVCSLTNCLACSSLSGKVLKSVKMSTMEKKEKMLAGVLCVGIPRRSRCFTWTRQTPTSLLLKRWTMLLLKAESVIDEGNIFSSCWNMGGGGNAREGSSRSKKVSRSFSYLPLCQKNMMSVYGWNSHSKMQRYRRLRKRKSWKPIGLLTGCHGERSISGTSIC